MRLAHPPPFLVIGIPIDRCPAFVQTNKLTILLQVFHELKPIYLPA